METSDVENLVLKVMVRSLELSPSECRQAKWRETREWDSFAFVEMIAEFEDAFDHEFDDVEIESMQDFSSMVAVLTEISSQ